MLRRGLPSWLNFEEACILYLNIYIYLILPPCVKDVLLKDLNF